MTKIITLPEVVGKDIMVYVTTAGEEYKDERDAVLAQIGLTYSPPAAEFAKALYPSSKSQNMIAKAIIEWEIYKRGLGSPTPSKEA